MDNAIAWLALLLAAVIPLAAFLLRSLLSAKIKESVRADFEGRLEALRSELRRSEEEFRADLRAKEVRLNRLAGEALEGRARRQAHIAIRKIEALEAVWSKFNKLGALKFGALAFSRFNLEKMEEEASRNANVRKLAETFSGVELADVLTDTKGETERLYVPEIVWAIFSAYQSILVTCSMHMKALAFGIEKASELIKWDKVAEVTKAVLPHQSDFIDKYGPSGLPHLLEEIEEKMFSQVRAAMEGKEEDELAIAQSAEIMSKVEAMMPPDEPVISKPPSDERA